MLQYRVDLPAPDVRTHSKKHERIAAMKTMPCPTATTISLAFCTFILAACAYDGGETNPLVRKATWYSYINADDLRSSCASEQGNSLRLIYNAIHTEQIRTYEISTPPGQEFSSMEARVLGPANLATLKVSSLDDLITPWRGTVATTRLRQQDMATLWQTLEDDSVFDPAPNGLHLASEEFFWLTAICRDGQFFYNAYTWPSDTFDAIGFDQLLFAWDMTGIPVNPPRQATMFDIYGEASPKKRTGAYYQLTIGENGLKGH